MSEVAETNVDQATEHLEEAKTFTQDDLSRVGAKEHSKGYSKALKELGFEDVESAKQALSDYQAWQESQKSQADKQQELLTAKETELTKASTQIQSLQAENEALKLGVLPDAVEDAVALAERLVGEGVTIRDALQQVLEKYPQFASHNGTEGKQPTFAAGGNPSVSVVPKKDPFQEIMDNYK